MSDAKMFEFLVEEPSDDAMVTFDGLIPPVEDVPLETYKPQVLPSEREEVHASAKTALVEAELEGRELSMSEEAENVARELFSTGRTPTKFERQMPEAMVKLDALLTAYDYDLLEDANRMRLYVTNRLVEESDDPDPKNRLRALEMLGKITEVGLFTERKEINIHTRTSEDLTEELRHKLEELKGKMIQGEVVSRG